MLRSKTLHKWIGIGIAEILLSLILIAIAPRFLNSDKPMLGFAIWLFVPTLLGGSSVYVTFRLWDVRKARQLFVTQFPDYRYLGMTDFLDVSSIVVAQRLDELIAIQDDPDCQMLRISPLDLLRGVDKDER